MEDECIEFICVPETTTIHYPDPKKCPKPTCPPGYEIIMEKSVSTKAKDCAKYVVCFKLNYVFIYLIICVIL